MKKGATATSMKKRLLVACDAAGRALTLLSVGLLVVPSERWCQVCLGLSLLFSSIFFSSSRFGDAEDFWVLSWVEGVRQGFLEVEGCGFGEDRFGFGSDVSGLEVGILGLTEGRALEGVRLGLVSGGRFRQGWLVLGDGGWVSTKGDWVLAVMGFNEGWVVLGFWDSGFLAVSKKGLGAWGLGEMELLFRLRD